MPLGGTVAKTIRASRHVALACRRLHGHVARRSARRASVVGCVISRVTPATSAVEVIAEALLGDERLEWLVGGRDDGHVRAVGLGVAEGLVDPLL